MQRFIKLHNHAEDLMVLPGKISTKDVKGQDAKLLTICVLFPLRQMQDDYKTKRSGRRPVSGRKL